MECWGKIFYVFKNPVRTYNLFLIHTRIDSTIMSTIIKLNRRFKLENPNSTNH